VNDEAIKQFNTGIGAALRIACFSECNDSILMWSHYADHHKGICIEYETRLLSLPDAIGFLHPVNYDPEHFDATEYFCSHPENNPWMLFIAACHKSPVWAYELEWRFIDICFRDRLSIKAKAIILGANIDPERRAEVITIAHDSQIPLSEASFDRSSFKMKFQQL